MNNNLIEIQKMLIKQMKNLDDDKKMYQNGKDEIARANALSASATVFIKTINVGLRIKEMQITYKINTEKMQKELGI